MLLCALNRAHYEQNRVHYESQTQTLYPTLFLRSCTTNLISPPQWMSHDVDDRAEAAEAVCTVLAMLSGIVVHGAQLHRHSLAHVENYITTEMKTNLVDYEGLKYNEFQDD